MPDTRDFSKRDPDRIVNATETLERAQARQPGQTPAITFGELYSGIRPPGPTEQVVSRVPGSELSPGIEVHGARHCPAGMRGRAEQFPTIGGTRTTALIRNLVSTSRYRAGVHVQGGAGPDDPVVVVHPHDNAGQVPAGMADAIGYPTGSRTTRDDTARPTVRRV